MDLDSVLVHKHPKKELGQYPAILTSHMVNNPYAICSYDVRVADFKNHCMLLVNQKRVREFSV